MLSSLNKDVIIIIIIININRSDYLSNKSTRLSI